MTGMFFDFDVNDIVLNENGGFATSKLGAQNCALIATSQTCRLTYPEVGEMLAARLINRRNKNTSHDIRLAKKAVERDGGKKVQILVTDTGQLSFNAIYES